MTVGDPDNILGRLKALVPNGWFAGSAGIRDAVFGGLADVLAWSYAQLWIVRSQARIGTASGWFLDLIAWDFFGARFLRRRNEDDGPWRERIRKEIFRPRVTRPSISLALENLTGVKAQVIEPWNPGDSGAYGAGGLAYAGSPRPSVRVPGYGIPGGGYSIGRSAYVQPTKGSPGSKGAGFYGSNARPFQVFVIAHRPRGSGVPRIAGYGIGPAGYGVGRTMWTGAVPNTGVLTDDEIYACVAETVAAGITAWVWIKD